MTDAAIKRALADLEAVALTIWGEARAEPVEGQVAVGSVIRNRLRDGRRWSRTWRGVCHQRWQFSCWEPAGGADNYEAVMRHARAFAEGELVVDRVLAPPSLRQCVYIARGVISGALADRVKGANHYYSPTAMRRGAMPGWAVGQPAVAVVKRHRFYRL